MSEDEKPAEEPGQEPTDSPKDQDSPFPEPIFDTVESHDKSGIKFRSETERDE